MRVTEGGIRCRHYNYCHPRLFPLCHPRLFPLCHPRLPPPSVILDISPSVILDISNRGSRVFSFSFFCLCSGAISWHFPFLGGLFRRD